MTASKTGTGLDAPRFITNLLATGASEGIARLTQIGVIALISREIGAVGFGIFGIAWSFQQMALAFVQIGPEMAGMRLYGEGGRRHLLVRLTQLKLLLAMIGLAAMVACSVALYGVRSAITTQSALQALVLIPIALSNGWVLKAASQFGDFAVLRIGQSMLFLLALLGALRIWPAASTIPVTEGIVSLTATVLVWRRAMRYINEAPVAMVRASDREIYARANWTALLKESFAVGFSTLCASLLWTVSVPLGGLFLSPRDSGTVAAVSRILAAINGLCQMFIQVFFPALVRRYGDSIQAGAETAASLLILATASGFLLEVLLMLTSRWVIPALLGANRPEATSLFFWWAPIIAPTAGASVLGYALLATGRTRLFTISLLGLAVGVTVLTAAAYRIFLDPLGAVAGIGAMLVYFFGLCLVSYRAQLISPADLSARILKPFYLRRFLMER